MPGTKEGVGAEGKMVFCKQVDGDVLHPDCIGVSVLAGATTRGTWVGGTWDLPTFLQPHVYPQFSKPKVSFKKGKLLGVFEMKP